MKGFINKLISRLQEKRSKYIFDQEALRSCQRVRLSEFCAHKVQAYDEVLSIVNQLAEEYAECYKDCEQCEAYNKEEHYCPKWCNVIKNTVKEMVENESGVILMQLLEAKKNCGEDSDCSECPFGQIEDRCILAELQIEGGNNDFCEWKLDGVYLHCQHDMELVISCLEDEKYRYNYCPVCGKKIKVVE